MPSLTTNLAHRNSSTLADAQLDLRRTALEQERLARVEQIEELAVDAAEGIALGDEARLQVTRMLAVTAEAALAEISAALCRLDNGSYGICERCANVIPDERLQVLPTSRLCTPCQSRMESRARRRTSNRV